MPWTNIEAVSDVGWIASDETHTNSGSNEHSDAVRQSRYERADHEDDLEI